MESATALMRDGATGFEETRYVGRRKQGESRYNRGMRILVACGEKPILRLVQVNMERQGWDVVLAEDNLSCIRLAKEEPPDVILLDRRLPMTGGRAVFAELSNDRRTAKIKVLVLGEQPDNEDWPSEESGGPSAFLSKPKDITKLVELVCV